MADIQSPRLFSRMTRGNTVFKEKWAALAERCATCISLLLEGRGEHSVVLAKTMGFRQCNPRGDGGYRSQHISDGGAHCFSPRC